VIKAVLSTLTALMLTVFMLKDRTWGDSGSLLMAAILWGLTVYLWLRWVRERSRP
jgi:hypothetical protein